METDKLVSQSNTDTRLDLHQASGALVSGIQSAPEFTTVAWYIPGKTVLHLGQGTLRIANGAVSFVDNNNHKLFSLPIYTISKASIHPGRVTFMTKSKHFNVLFYNAKEEAGKMYGSLGTMEAGNLTGNKGAELTGAILLQKTAKRDKQIINAAAPRIEECKEALLRYGLKVTGSTNWKKTYIIAYTIVAVLSVLFYLIGIR